MAGSPRLVITPNRKIPLRIPEGMTRIEFFNSPCNLRNLAEENGLLRTAEGFLLYRKLLGHSLEFDTSIILDTSRAILNPLGRPVRRDELSEAQKVEWSRMTCTILQYMLARYPDPGEHLILCGEASLDPTWPLSKTGVPSIRMIHNHFMVFPKEWLRQAADGDDPNLTDGGHHSLFSGGIAEVYRRFFDVLEWRVLTPIATEACCLSLTGYPRGLMSWEVRGGVASLEDPRFWHEYDQVLLGFLDFYRAFFAQVSSRGAPVPGACRFPDQVRDVLYFNNDFFRAVKVIRDRVLEDPEFANRIRWNPAYKQILYRDDWGRLIVTISPNSVGNAITELLGIVVKRVEDEEAYGRAEPALVERLLEVRDILVRADLGEPLATPSWPAGPLAARVRRCEG